MGDRTVAVSSVVYNLAGEVTRRPDFLKSLIFGAVIEDADSIASVINEGYRNSPAFRFRNFARWARSDPDFQSTLGLTQSSLLVQPEIDLTALAAILDDPDNGYVTAGQTARIDYAEIGSADIAHWARQWVADNHPTLLHTDFESDYNTITGEIQVYLERVPLLTGPLVPMGDPFTPGAFLPLQADYDLDGTYLYVRFTPTSGSSETSPVPGVMQYLDTDPFPDLSGWEELSLAMTPVEIDVGATVDVLYTFSDGRPSMSDNETFSEMQSFEEQHSWHRLDEYQGTAGTEADETWTARTDRESWLYTHVENVVTVETTYTTLPGGVIRTNQVTTTRPTVTMYRRYQDNTSQITHMTWHPQKILIYQKGTYETELEATSVGLYGSLNSFFATETTAGNYYPPIPFRHDNTPITDKPQSWIVTLPEEFFDPGTGILLPAYVGRFMFGKNASIDITDPAPEDVAYGAIYSIYAADIVTHTVVINNVSSGFLANVFGASAPVISSLPMNVLDGGNGFMAATWITLPAPPVADEPSATEEAYPICKKAFRKATGGSYDKTLDLIQENESIGSIDYAQAVFGVSLNVEENACRKYLYKFLEEMRNSVPIVTAAEEAAWWAQWQEANASQAAYETWKEAQASGGGGTYTEAPVPTRHPVAPNHTLKVFSQHEDVAVYRIRLNWAFIVEEVGTGVCGTALSPMTAGEVRLEMLDDWSITETVGALYYDNAMNIINNRFLITYQETANTWKRLTVTGFVHKNEVYRHKNSVTTARRALTTDLDAGKESRFIVPMHEDVYRDMSLVDQTQMAAACVFLLFNCYEIHEAEWYESGWFKVLVIVAIVVVSIVAAILTGGGSLVIEAGTLGALTGLGATASLVMAAVINVTAGLILGLMLTEVSVALFGEKWGNIIGGVIMFALTLGLAAGFDPSTIFEQLTSPTGLIAASCAIGDGVASYIQFETEALAEATRKFLARSNKELAELQKKYEKEFGDGSKIDPEYIKQFISELTEKPQAFLARTLMTGSDIVELNLGAIGNFAALTTSIRLP